MYILGYSCHKVLAVLRVQVFMFALIIFYLCQEGIFCYGAFNFTKGSSIEVESSFIFGFHGLYMVII